MTPYCACKRLLIACYHYVFHVIRLEQQLSGIIIVFKGLKLLAWNAEVEMNIAGLGQT